MINLLLVEDDESLAYIEKTGLEDIIGGYKVTTATNGKLSVVTRLLLPLTARKALKPGRRHVPT